MTKTNAVLGRSNIIIWTVRGLCCLAARWVVLELPFLCEVLVGRFEARCKEAWQAFESLSRVAVVNCLPSNYSTHYASRGFSRKCADFKHGTRWTLCHTLASHLLPAVLSNSSTWIAPSFTFWHCSGQHKKKKKKIALFDCERGLTYHVFSSFLTFTKRKNIVTNYLLVPFGQLFATLQPPQPPHSQMLSLKKRKEQSKLLPRFVTEWQSL